MAYGTWEEARRCPRCGLSGELSLNETRNVTKHSGRDVTAGAVIRTIYCRNSRCRWFNTSWTVQVNPDGTIPDPEARRGPKQFQKLDPARAAQLKSYFEDLQHATETGGEVRNR